MAGSNQNDISLREGAKEDFQQIAHLLCCHNYLAAQPQWSASDYLKWLRWKYLENPDGPGRIFLAEDRAKQIIGLNAFLPRRFTSSATGTFSAYHGVDAFIAPEMRGKGIYSRLYPHAMGILDSPKISFPSKIVTKVTLREGVRVVGNMQKWVFPVSVRQSTTGKYFDFILLPVNALLRLYALLWLGRHPHDLKMKPTTRFETDFELDPRFIHGVRSAAFLNWRFIENPTEIYSVYEFVENGVSIGYCVYLTKRSKARIHDFVARRRHADCFRILVDFYSETGITTLDFRGIGLRLRKYGFTRRRIRPSCFTTFRTPEGSWMLTLGDRDY